MDFAANITPVLFWFSLAMLAYTFAGFPMVLYVVGKFFHQPIRKSAPRDYPPVSIVLVAHNEEERIAARVRNLLHSDYPQDRIEVIVVSDASTDGTAAGVKELGDARVRLAERRERGGKAPCLNAGVAMARHEIVVFCDARQQFAPDTICELVKNFSDPNVGAVSGNYDSAPAGSSVGGAVDFYWRMEKFIRHAESRFDSSVGCSGSIYAIRKALYRPIPEDTILDDVVIPMQIALQGFRLGYDPDARVFDPQPYKAEREQIRKRRTLAGNFQILFRYPDWLLPWRNRLWWQLISHKYLRLSALFFMIMAFATNAALLNGTFYQAAFIAQCAFYSMAVFGLLFSSVRTPLFSVPAGFLFLNLMTFHGLVYYLRRANHRGWELVKPG
jgi:cellulose synthase/poly-beta-1,6-N-acetylglucosamine synthase-like glycosyltransferase